jgi:hypothetical protein
VLKMVFTRVKRGAVQEVVRRNGKVRAVNHDRGVKHCLVRNQWTIMGNMKLFCLARWSSLCRA